MPRAHAGNGRSILTRMKSLMPECLPLKSPQNIWLGLQEEFARGIRPSLAISDRMDKAWRWTMKNWRETCLVPQYIKAYLRPCLSPASSEFILNFSPETRHSIAVPGHPVPADAAPACGGSQQKEISAGGIDSSGLLGIPSCGHPVENPFQAFPDAFHYSDLTAGKFQYGRRAMACSRLR